MWSLEEMYLTSYVPEDDSPHLLIYCFINMMGYIEATCMGRWLLVALQIRTVTENKITQKRKPNL